MRGELNNFFLSCRNRIECHCPMKSLKKSDLHSILKEVFGLNQELEAAIYSADQQYHEINKIIKNLVQAQAQPSLVTILGFYSQNHQGLFTHHDAFTHMHVRNADGTAMGHVDYLESGNGSFTLLLPKK